MAALETFDVVIVGGGPAGATAATDLARQGRSVLLLDRAGRIKPCGGAIPPRLIRDFDIPDHILVARATGACMHAPSSRKVDMPIEGGFVGMVDREEFDEWLRVRAAESGATRRAGTFETIDRDEDGTALIRYRTRSGGDRGAGCVRARTVIGADGALSAVGRQTIPGSDRVRHVVAYHEIIRTPKTEAGAPSNAPCDIYYQGTLSPDFYAWVFPHGETTSVGTGSARKGFSLRDAVTALRAKSGLGEAETIRREGAPIPLKPLRRWDNGRDVILAGDAAGVVAPASGEGIYYAMLAGRLTGEAVHTLLETGDPRALKSARRRFMKEHGRVFWVLGMMQWFWYRNDAMRERFVSICRDRDVQKLTWDAYMNKRLVRAKPVAHARIFFKDLAHLFRLVSP
jgi:geranylgeranyl reductase